MLSGGNTGTSTNEGFCTLIVKDANSNNQDTCKFDVDIKYQSGITDCIGDESSCAPNGNSFFKCEEGVYVLYPCSFGYVCSYSGGDAYCMKGGGGVVPGNPKCESCEDFALSSLIGSLWKEKQCEPKSFLGIHTQTTTTCLFSFIRLLLIPIILIFSILLLPNMLLRLFSSMNKGILWGATIILALITSYLVYVAFWVGVIIFLIYVIILSAVKFLKPF